MADVLSVIADIIKQDKQQKREHNKIMREVKKKMKEAEVSEEEGAWGWIWWSWAVRHSHFL